MEDRYEPGDDEMGVDVPVDEDTTAIPPVPPTRRFPSSNIGRPRIEGVEAGIAAGIVTPDGGESDRSEGEGLSPRHLARHEPQPLYEEPIPDEIAEGVELPDWSDPPTREVPRVLLRPGEEPTSAMRGPVWRESERDFDEDSEAFAEMVSASVPVIAHDEAGEEFDFDEAYDRARQDSGYAPEAEMFAEPDPLEPAGGVRFAGRRKITIGRAQTAGPMPVAVTVEAPAPPPAAGRRNPLIATETGLLLGGAALLCFWAGPAFALAIASLVLLLAAAECFQSFRKSRYQPATLFGLVAAPGFAVATYVKGIEALPVLIALSVAGTMCWYLVGVTRRNVVANMSVTLLGIGWIAGLGAFAGLLLDPTAFPDRHGVAYLLGAAVATVAYDVGGYVVGSRLGKHKLAPAVSPNKTWEGLVGGSAAAFIVSIAIVSQVSPWSVGRAFLLGLVVAVVAPIGDLVESMIKRDLNLKDMGTLLPAHGGVLDRVDALLFVLPATYFLVRLFHG